jgi:hypothetical protein
VAVAAALISLAPAPAPAAGSQPGKCTKLAAKPVATKITGTLTGCSPLAATGGSGAVTFVSTASGALRITIKWAAGKGTTKANVKFANQSTPGKCGSATRVKISGKVTGGSGVVTKTVKKGQPVTGSACYGRAAVKLEPGTALKF